MGVHDRWVPFGFSARRVEDHEWSANGIVILDEFGDPFDESDMQTKAL